MPADAWGMAATIKTRKGVHKMTMDRWGDSTHKMSAYNNRYQPSTRDQRQIDRMKRETMVLYPILAPNPVLPKRIPGFSGGQGVFPRVTGGLRGLNWRAEGLRVHPPGMDCNQRMKKDPLHQASIDNKEKQPLMSQEEDSIGKVLPEGHTEECLTLHLLSTEVTQLQRMKLYKPQQQRESTQTPHRLPSPGMNMPTWTKKKVGKKKTVLGMPLPQKQWLKPPSNCTQPCPTGWIKPYRRLWINQAPPA